MKQIFKAEFSSVQTLSRVQLFATPWTAACQASLSITNSRSSLRLSPLSPWCHPAISSSVVPFSSCPQSLPASESFPMSQLFTWGGQSIGVSLTNTDEKSNICHQEGSLLLFKVYGVAVGASVQYTSSLLSHLHPKAHYVGCGSQIWLQCWAQ